MAPYSAAYELLVGNASKRVLFYVAVTGKHRTELTVTITGDYTAKQAISRSALRLMRILVGRAGA